MRQDITDLIKGFSDHMSAILYAFGETIIFTTQSICSLC